MKKLLAITALSLGLTACGGLDEDQQKLYDTCMTYKDAAVKVVYDTLKTGYKLADGLTTKEDMCYEAAAKVPTDIFTRDLNNGGK